MPILTRQIENHSDNLIAQAALARARAEAAVAHFQMIREEAAQTRRESTELREACREARLRCHQTAQRGRWRTGTSTELEHLEIAYFVAHTLSALGLPAFVFQPSQDTAVEI